MTLGGPETADLQAPGALDPLVVGADGQVLVEALHRGVREPDRLLRVGRLRLDADDRQLRLVRVEHDARGQRVGVGGQLVVLRRPAGGQRAGHELIGSQPGALRDLVLDRAVDHQVREHVGARPERLGALRGDLDDLRVRRVDEDPRARDADGVAPRLRRDLELVRDRVADEQGEHADDDDRDLEAPELAEDGYGFQGSRFRPGPTGAGPLTINAGGPAFFRARTVSSSRRR